jgi:HlyD family secretion protein
MATAEAAAGNGNERRWRRWLPRGAIAGLLAAAVVFALRNVLFGMPVEVRAVQRSDIVQSVVASGRIMSPQRVSVGAIITGRVAGIPVAEGQAVRGGDVLVRIDDENERAALAQARAAVEQGEARLRQLREVGLPAAEEALAQARTNATNARQQFERTRNLREKGFVSQSALDDVQRNLEVAESQLKAARLQVAANAPDGSEFRLALTQLEQARAAEALARAHLDRTRIVAPVDGILIARNVEPGDVVQPGRELMVLAPAGETQIVVQIDERHLAQLRTGQKALVSADAYPRERFEAELFYINPGIDALRGSVEVKLRVRHPPAYLRQDMTVSVDVEIDRRAAAIVVAADAVREAAGPHPWVLAIEGGRAVRRDVRVGLRGEGRIEVLEGVAPGEVLVAAGELGARAGQRVRARPGPAGSAP